MYGGSIPVMLFEFIYGDITQFQTILVLLQRYSTSFYWTGATGYTNTEPIPLTVFRRIYIGCSYSCERVYVKSIRTAYT